MGAKCRKLVPHQHLDDPLCAVLPKAMVDKLNEQFNAKARQRNAKKKNGKKKVKVKEEPVCSGATGATAPSSVPAPVAAPEVTPEAPANKPSKQEQGRPKGEKDGQPCQQCRQCNKKVPVQATTDAVVADL